MAAKKKAKKKAAKKTAAPKAVSDDVAPDQAAAKKTAAKKAAAPKTAAAEAPAAAAEGAPLADAVAETALAAEPEAAPAEPLLPPMPRVRARRKDGVITLAYGTEADQAFMIFALATGQVDTEDREYAFVRKELQDLEEEARLSAHDVTTISFGAYPALRIRYLLLACGGGYGDHRGPVLVARTPVRSSEVEGLEVAVSGENSAGAMALRLWLSHHNLEFKPYPAREIALRVRAGHVRSGILVNEDIITYRNHNLVTVVDLGAWWGEETEGLPLAIKAMAIRRDIPAEERAKIALDLKRSIAYALGHREEALDWTMQFAGRIERETMDRYISRYVNDLSLDCGERGRQASRLLYQRSNLHGFLETAVEPVYHGDEGIEG